MTVTYTKHIDSAVSLHSVDAGIICRVVEVVDDPWSALDVSVGEIVVNTKNNDSSFNISRSSVFPRHWGVLVRPLKDGERIILEQ